MTRRPLAVTLIAWLYILMGTVGFFYHLREISPKQPFATDTLWIEILRLLAIVAGAFMLRAKDWARWLAVAWMAIHVVIGFLNSPGQGLIHAAFLAIILFFLTRPPVNHFFRAAN